MTPSPSHPLREEKKRLAKSGLVLSGMKVELERAWILRARVVLGLSTTGSGTDRVVPFYF